MGLGEFYREAEKIIIIDLISYIQSTYHHKNIRVLNIYTSQTKQISNFSNGIEMSIGNEPNEFLKQIDSYRNSLGGRKFDIINCRFTARNFMSSVKELMGFIGFVSDTLRTGGIFMGFLLDTNKLNGIFTDKSSLYVGQYGIEYLPQTETTETYTPKLFLVNGEPTGLVDFSTFELICKKFGMIHVETVILRSLHNNSLNWVTLNDTDKQFGFLNYVFLFQKL